ncbi:hypothetical protein, partial [Devosia sp.]|uniref:hypothetical protein n=1 Tax=Devosia sp. TaxID=1871048 RepID=UPI0027363282
CLAGEVGDNEVGCGHGAWFSVAGATRWPIKARMDWTSLSVVVPRRKSCPASWWCARVLPVDTVMAELNLKP